MLGGDAGQHDWVTSRQVMFADLRQSKQEINNPGSKFCIVKKENFELSNRNDKYSHFCCGRSTFPGLNPAKRSLTHLAFLFYISTDDEKGHIHSTNDASIVQTL